MKRGDNDTGQRGEAPPEKKGALSSGSGAVELRYQRRLLSRLLIAVFLLGWFPAFLPMYLVRDDLPIWNTAALVAVASLLLLIPLVLINRRGWFHTAAMLSVLLMTAAIFTITFFSPHPHRFIGLMYLTIPAIFGSMFLSMRFMLLYCISVEAAILLAGLIGQPPPHELPAIYYAVCCTAVLLARHHYRLLEIIRRRSLRRINERYRLLLDTAFDGIAVVREDRIVEVNPGLLKMAGYSAADLTGRPAEALLPEWPPPDHIADERPAVPRETQLRSASGEIIPAEYAINRINSETGRPWIVALRDISQRKAAEKEREELQAQIQQAQKLESLGVLAGGIAHDFNNLLAIILGHTEVLRIRGTTPEQMDKAIGAIAKSSQRGARLTRQLLGFAHKGKRQNIVFDMHVLIRETESMLEHTLPKHIRSELYLNAENAMVMGDPGQFEQALINLGINAADAMPAGGLLRITTASLDADSEAVSGFEESTGQKLRIQVIDTGRGIPEDLLPRIFDPFVTTKVQGKGTGLGLAMVYGIVRSHGGHVTAASSLEEGTVFTITLPVTGHRASREPAPPETAEARKPAHILIVEDEESIVDLLESMLDYLGYTTASARDGQEAVEIFEKDGEAFDLVILDLNMPRMNGETCFHELRKRKPEVRIIISTGYDNDETQKRLRAAGAAGITRKPYRMDQLAALITRTVGGSGNGSPAAAS
jgi:PAS domain S-box-containing protein